MVSTRRKPSAGKNEHEDEESNGESNTETLDVDGELPLTFKEGISNATTDSTHQAFVSEASSYAYNHASGLSSSSDTSVVEAPIVSSSKVDSGALSSKAPHSSSTATSLKQLPKKKTLKPNKPLLAQRSGATRRVASAHTRSNAGNAELLTGVEVISSHTDREVSRPGGSSLVKSMNKSCNGQQKYSNGGVAGTRNGSPVTKIVMNTGTLYIYIKTHRAEFVRTK